MARYYSDKKSSMAKEPNAGMISLDRSARSLLPQSVIQKNWSQGDETMEGRHISSDLYTGVQKKLKADSMEFNRAFKEGKY